MTSAGSLSDRTSGCTPGAGWAARSVQERSTVLQAVELKVKRVAHFGTCDSTTYPMAKKRHTLEFLREKAHLRPRTNVIGVVARVRNALSFATHCFFQQHGFAYVHTPLLTASDCEGAGEMFQVRPLLPRALLQSLWPPLWRARGCTLSVTAAAARVK